MSHFLNYPEIYGQPIRLSPEQKKEPFQVLSRFFLDYNLAELRQILSDVSDTCLTSDDPPFSVGIDRANIIFYFTNLEILFEAIFLLVKQQEKDVSNKQA